MSTNSVGLNRQSAEPWRRPAGPPATSCTSRSFRRTRPRVPPRRTSRASALVDRLVAQARGTVELLVAPEIGFGRYILTRSARAAARDEGQILAWAAAVARVLGCHVCVGHVRADARTGEIRT